MTHYPSGQFSSLAKPIHSRRRCGSQSLKRAPNEQCLLVLSPWLVLPNTKSVLVSSLIYPIECGRSDIVPVLDLSLKKAWQLLLLNFWEP